MATIDERVVSMSFENSRFEANVARTMGTLDRLNRSINSVSKTNPLANLEGSANRVSFGGLTRAIDGIGSHLSTLQTTAAVAFGNIAAVAAQKLGTIVKSFTLDPITAGFKNYETQINAVQTILANTGLKGRAGLSQVSAALNNLNRYANLTVYNFSEMARNIGTFTAAGVKLKPATESIKGIANLAAMSGSSSEQASGAMYQLSQAIAAGKVNLQDWNSVVNAGMGGKVFQDALIRTGVAMGTISKSAVEVDKATGQATIHGQSFRQSLSAKPGQTSWLTSGVLTATLRQFTGDMSKAQLASMGFNQQQIKTIQEQARTAVNAATQVKTFSQLMQALKEEVASAWATIFKTLFGNINQAKELFSGLHTFLENALTGPILRFNKVLESWAKMGGRSELLAGLKQGFQDLHAVVKPIFEAFRDIFPPTTARQLLDLTRGFKSLMDQLKIGPQTADNLRRTFRGVFAVLDIGWNIVKDLAKVFLDLFRSAAPAAGGILGITGGIGDFLVKVDNAVKKGQGLAGVFKFIGSVLKVPIDLLGALAGAIGSLFEGKDVSGAAHQFGTSIGGLASNLGPLGAVLTGVSRAWEGFVKLLSKARDVVAPYLKQAGDAVKGFGTTIGDALQHANWGNVFAAVQTGILGGIFLAIKKALGSGGPIETIVGSFKKIVGGAGEVIDGVSGNLQHLQRAIQVATLLEIAAAMGILAGAIFVLSTINPRRISQALGAVAVGMGEMVGAILLLRGATTGAMSLPIVAGAIVLLSSAMVVLAVAMKIFATMSWSDIAKGLTGVAGGLTAVGLATKLISGPNVIAAGLALAPLAVGLSILAGAMKIFATMSWEGIAKGLVSIGLGLTAIGLGVTFMPTTLPILGVGLMAVSVGLTMLAGAIEAFSLMNLGKTAISIGVMAGALVVLGLAINAIPPTMAVQAAGLLVLAVAMTALSGAITIFGHMSLHTVVQGVIAMGGALIVLGLGLQFMAGTLPGTAALLAAAAAFAILAPALAVMGALPIGVIVKGLGAMAAVLLVLGVAGAVAGPGFVLLGAGILAIGVGLAAVGGAVYLFAKGISLLSGTSVKAMAALIAAAGAFIAVFPSMVINFVKGIVTILGTVVQLAPKIVSALVTIAGDLLGAIVTLSPKIALAIGALIMAVVKVLDSNFGPILDAGIRMLEALLTGIGRNIGKITNEGARVVVGFMNGLARNATRLVGAGVNLMVSFLRGVGTGIPRMVGAAARVIATFLTNIGRSIGRVIAAGADIIGGILTGLGQGLARIVTAGATAIVRFLSGIQRAIPQVRSKAVSVAGTFMNNLVSGILGLVDRVYNAVIRLLNGLAREIRKNSKPLYDAGWNLAWAIVQGILKGLGDLAGHIIHKAESIAKSIPGKFLDALGIGSPSKVMMDIAHNTMLGLAVGLDNGFPKVDKAMDTAAKGVVATAKSAFGKMPSALAEHINFQPTITPVLDLSSVKKDASQLSNLMGAPVLTPKVSTDQAAKISDQQQGAAAPGTPTATATTVTLNQNNYSPDPLPAIEIYRQTKNQLSQIKSLVS